MKVYLMFLFIILSVKYSQTSDCSVVPAVEFSKRFSSGCVRCFHAYRGWNSGSWSPRFGCLLPFSPRLCSVVRRESVQAWSVPAHSRLIWGFSLWHDIRLVCLILFPFFALAFFCSSSSTRGGGGSQTTTTTKTNKVLMLMLMMILLIVFTWWRACRIWKRAGRPHWIRYRCTYERVSGSVSVFGDSGWNLPEIDQKSHLVTMSSCCKCNLSCMQPLHSGLLSSLELHRRSLRW